MIMQSWNVHGRWIREIESKIPQNGWGVSTFDDYLYRNIFNDCKAVSSRWLFICLALMGEDWIWDNSLTIVGFLYDTALIDVNISSLESQNGIITIQRCSIEYQKGTITIDFVHWIVITPFWLTTDNNYMQFRCIVHQTHSKLILREWVIFSEKLVNMSKMDDTQVPFQKKSYTWTC